MNDSNDVIEPSNLPQRRLPLGELLVMAGVLDRAALKEALARQRGTRVRLGTLLVQMGVITEAQITQAVAGQLGLHVVDLVQFRPREDALRAVPYTMAKEHGVLPLIVDDANDGGSKLLYAAFSDPTNQRAVNALQIHTGLRMRPVMIEESTLVAAIDDYYMALRNVESSPSYLDAAPLAGVPSAPEVMPLDASYLTPLETTQASDPWAAQAVGPAQELSLEAQTPRGAVIETLDLAYVTPLLTTPTVEAWPTSESDLELSTTDASPSLDLDTREAWTDQGHASMEIFAAPLVLEEAPGALVDVAPAVIDLFGDAIPSHDAAAQSASAPFPFVADPFGDLGETPMALSSDDDLEEIDDADVSPLDDGDPFDRSFSGFSNDADDDVSSTSPALPAVSVDPFFAEPLPSEIVTLAPDQLRALISAAVERGTLDPVEIDAVKHGDGNPDEP